MNGRIIDAWTSIRWALSRIFAFMALSISVGSLIGYACGNPALLIWTYNDLPMALPTAIALALLSIASILKSNPL